MAEALGWRWEFGVQIPPLLLCIGVASVAIPRDLGIAGERKGVWQALREFDAKGSLLLTAAICFLILGLVRCLCLSTRPTTTWSIQVEANLSPSESRWQRLAV